MSHRTRPTASEVPWWVVSAAVGAPLTLLVATYVARGLDSVRYSPVHQTLSTLAAHGAGDWVMRAAFVAIGCCYIAIAAGLDILPRTSRILLAVAGLCGWGIATMQPTPGTLLSAHKFFLICATLAGVLCPLLASSREPDAPPPLRAPFAMAATIVLTAVAGWFLHAALADNLVGLAERACVYAQSLWLLAVVITARWYRARGARQAISSKDPPDDRVT